MPREPRMDGVLMLAKNGELWIREMRRVRKGELIAVGAAEDGSEGILVYAQAFLGGGDEGEFKFMSSEVSREKPIDYALMAHLLIEERDRGGYPIWVTGPALVHSRARSGHDVVHREWLRRRAARGQRRRGARHRDVDLQHDARHELAGRLDAGRARAAHARDQRVRAAGSIEAAVANGTITDGIMHACVVHKVPYVLTGSIRDDGPLPGVINDMAEAQDAMKAHTIKATMAILIATALHAIATGNMLPAFVTEPDGTLRELPTICVDSSEFVVSKLKDRGTHQAFGVVTNAQDFMHILKLYVERELDARGAESRRASGAAAALK